MILKKIAIFLGVFLFLALVSGELGYDNPNLPRLTAPTPSVTTTVVTGNGTFNQTLTDLSYWRLDGTNAPPSADWNMWNKDLLFNVSFFSNDAGELIWYNDETPLTLINMARIGYIDTWIQPTTGLFINSSSGILLDSVLGTYVYGGLVFVDNQAVKFGTGAFNVPDSRLYYNSSENNLILDKNNLGSSAIKSFKVDMNLETTGTFNISNWLIDNAGDGFRFYHNDGTGEVTLRTNDTSVKIGETNHRRNLNVYGNINTFDPAGGMGNINANGSIIATQNITAQDHFIGDGSLLSKVNETDPFYSAVWTNTSTIITASLGRSISASTGNVTAWDFISSATIGTQPYKSTSTTLNTNLNADLLDSLHIATSGAGIPDMSKTNSWSGAQTFTKSPTISLSKPQITMIDTVSGSTNATIALGSGILTFGTGAGGTTVMFTVNTTDVISNARFITSNNITVGQVLQLSSITLPPCVAASGGSIARNGTGLYYCNSTQWRNIVM